MNTGFISTRFHGTDGVSLESRKWAHVLEKEGHECFWFAGQLDTPPPNSYLSEQAFYRREDVLALHAKLFGVRRRERRTTDEIHAMKERLKDELYAFVEKFKIELLVPQNILAIPVHVPLGIAMTEFITETRLPVIAHHHDFSWERERFAITAVPDYLDMAFPPAFAGAYANVVINSTAQAELARRRGIPSTIIPNVFDFENPPEDDAHGSDLREELGIHEDEVLVLQPTRVVNRKGIEHAVELVRQMSRHPNKRICLVVSHNAGDEGYEYFHTLKDLAVEAGIRMLFIGDRVHEERSEDDHGRKRYSLWDVYPHADLVTYPSNYEGFGNAFLEAHYFKKPVLVNRYSIYIRDIEPLGFKVIGMDGFISNSVVEQVWNLLDDPDRIARWGEHNYELCRAHYSYSALRKELGVIMLTLFGE